MREQGASDDSGPDVGEDHARDRRPPAGTEALRRLGQRVDVDRAKAGVEREVDVRERKDDVRGGQEAVRLREEPVRGVLVDGEETDDEDDRRHDERNEGEEADHGAAAAGA